MLFASSVAVLRAVGAIDLFRQTEFGSASALAPGFWIVPGVLPAPGFGCLLRIISVPIAVPPGACSRHLCPRCISCEPFVTLIYNIERLA